MKIHFVSETPFVMKATGVHTAFIDLEDMPEIYAAGLFQ